MYGLCVFKGDVTVVCGLLFFFKGDVTVMCSL